MDKISRFKMIRNSTILLLTFFVFVARIEAQNISPSENEIFEMLSHKTGSEISSEEFFRTAPANEAWKAFVSLYFDFKDNRDVTKKVGAILAENPEIEEYLSEELANLPNNYENVNERGDLLRPIGFIPAPWALKLLGYYLQENSPMIRPSVEPDYPTAENSSLAVVGLENMDFSDAPLKSSSGITPEVKRAWRVWWDTNKDRVEERIREINPSYRMPQKNFNDQATTSTAAEQKLSSALGTAQKPYSTRPIIQKTSVNFPAVASIIIVVALVVGALVFLILRKS